MRPGVEILSDTPGTGPEATRGSSVTISLKLRLNRGDEVRMQEIHSFTLGKRELIAGLEYAIEGPPAMRVGGKRSVRLQPHLAYREKGVPGIVPANAVLIAEIELQGLQ